MSRRVTIKKTWSRHCESHEEVDCLQTKNDKLVRLSFATSVNFGINRSSMRDHWRQGLQAVEGRPADPYFTRELGSYSNLVQYIARFEIWLDVELTPQFNKVWKCYSESRTTPPAERQFQVHAILCHNVGVCEHKARWKAALVETFASNSQPIPSLSMCRLDDGNSCVLPICKFGLTPDITLSHTWNSLSRPLSQSLISSIKASHSTCSKPYNKKPKDRDYMAAMNDRLSHEAEQCKVKVDSPDARCRVTGLELLASRRSDWRFANYWLERCK